MFHIRRYRNDTPSFTSLYRIFRKRQKRFVIHILLLRIGVYFRGKRNLLSNSFRGRYRDVKLYGNPSSSLLGPLERCRWIWKACLDCGLLPHRGIVNCRRGCGDLNPSIIAIPWRPYSAQLQDAIAFERYSQRHRGGWCNLRVHAIGVQMELLAYLFGCQGCSPSRQEYAREKV